MADKIPRFTLGKINAPLAMGLEHDKRLRFGHDNHGKSVLVLTHQNNDMVKCVPMGWDDDRISDWGFELPADLIEVQASPNVERKMIQKVFGGSVTFSQAKQVLADHNYLFTEEVHPEESTIYVPRWACLATYKTATGELVNTSVYSPAKPAEHPTLRSV